jgi:WD40 repeat protein
MVNQSDPQSLKMRVKQLKCDLDDIIRAKKNRPFDGIASLSAKYELTRNIEALKTRRILKGHFGKVYSMHWSGNSQELLSASQDGKLIVWDAMLGNDWSLVSNTFFPPLDYRKRDTKCVYCILTNYHHLSFFLCHFIFNRC